MPVGPEAPKMRNAPAEATDADGKPMDAQWEGDPTAAAYAVMEERETQQIMRGLTGQEIEDFVYSIPFRCPKEKGGKVECKAPGHCKYRDTTHEPHIHVTGVGVGGMDEIRRIYEGVQTVVLGKPKREHRDGRYYWYAEAVALDAFTGNMTTAHAEQPESPEDRGAQDARASFGPRIAERKAKRNAVGELLPQAILNKLKQWALEGKRTFSPEEARRLIDSLGFSRQGRQIRCMLDPKTGGLIVATNAATPVLSSGMAAAAPPLPAAPGAPARELPEPPKPAAKAPPKPRKSSGGKAARGTKSAKSTKEGRKASEKQTKMLYAISKQQNVDEAEFKAYLQNGYDVGSTRDVLADDVSAIKEWLEAWQPTEPATEEGDGGEGEDLGGDPFRGMSDEELETFEKGLET